jgi:hypothetical protein
MSRARKPTFTWSSELPRRPGWFWHRESPNHEDSIVRVFREEGEDELSVRYGTRANDVCWLANWRDHQWSHRSIPVPVEPPAPIEPPPLVTVPPGKVVIKDRRGRVIGVQG